MKIRASILLLLLSHVVNTFAQGALSPPGAPAPTMKTLDQIEARTPISGLFSITRGGSYYLTTNITGAASQTAITISTNHVTLDLNGFSLNGLPGSANGIIVLGVRSNIVVRNGAVRGWGAAGIAAGAAQFCRFEDLIVSRNSGIGLDGGAYCLVLTSLAESNVSAGIYLGIGAQVVQCTAAFNGDGGIDVAQASKVDRCFAERNGGDGILLRNSGSIVQDCRANANGLSGIRSTGGGGQLIRNCTVDDNSNYGISLAACCNSVLACIASANSWDGIRVADHSTVSDNICRFNRSGTTNSAGIRLTSINNHVEHNHVYLNDIGIHAGPPGNVIIRNHAHGNPTNYFTTGSTALGPLITTFGTITNQNPWANFSY